MDPFERKIQALPWAKPSAGLKERIFSEPVGPRYQLFFLARRIGIGWAAVFVVMAGLAGYLLGQQLTTRGPSAAVQPTPDFQLIETGSGQNLFDMTPRASEILPGDLVVSHYVAEDF